MTSERQMSYEPVVGDKIRFVVPTNEVFAQAEPGDIGTVVAGNGDLFLVNLEKEDHGGLISMSYRTSIRIPHDLMRIELIERVPTPCYNNVDVDAVIQSRKLEDIPGCCDVEIKALTLHQMCKEIRRYRIDEKSRIERSQRGETEA